MHLNNIFIKEIKLIVIILIKHIEVIKVVMFSIDVKNFNQLAKIDYKCLALKFMDSLEINLA